MPTCLGNHSRLSSCTGCITGHNLALPFRTLPVLSLFMLPPQSLLPPSPAPAVKQQHALLCFLAMMGGVLALNGTKFTEQWPRAKWAVLMLAAANGLVGVALQVQGGLARQPRWVEALPWPGA